jgi:hypothetical protein
MHSKFFKKLIAIENQWDNRRHISWSVFNHETNASLSFNNKLEATLYKNTLPHATIYFHWYDETFSAIDTTVEPPESYRELLKQRAIELRERYSYLRLWFSGGSDSTTALNAFVENGIHIDEIIVNCWLDYGHSNPLLSANKEITLSADPYLDSIADKLTKTKITKIVLNLDDYKLVLAGADKLGEIPYLHSMDMGSHLFGLNCVQYPWEKLLDSTTHDNYCDLFGGTKPVIQKRGNIYSFYMIDTGLQDNYLSRRSEDFFISPQDPRLFLKTAHMLKNYVSSLNLSDSQVDAFCRHNEFRRMYNRAMGRDPIGHDCALFKCDRSSGYYAKEIDFTIRNFKHFRFVENLKHDTEWLRLFKAHTDSFYAMQKEFEFLWNHNEDGKPDARLGYKGHLSTFYNLSQQPA